MESLHDLTAMPARIALVDDHPLFRMGLRDLLRAKTPLEIAFDVGTTTEAIALAAQQRIDLAVIDMIIPPTSGVELVRAIRSSQPTCRILGLSFLEDETRIADMLRAGANGFALKTQPPPDIVDAIHRVLAGERYLPPSISRDAVERLATAPTPFERLTNREREVFELLVRGYSNDDIGSRLFIARRTVEAHRHHLMHKLDVRSIVDLVRLAVRHGIAGA